MTPEEVAAAFDVSRETMERLRIYAALIERWNRRINLVAPSTLPDLWGRHIADSLQLWPLRPEPCSSWVDLGSGGGLPGLVIAACAAESGSPTVSFVESDSRKSAFLATAAHEMGLAVSVHTDRIEALPPQRADIVSARALAPLLRLLPLALRHGHPDSIYLFPKGTQARTELTAAATRWHTRVDQIASRTDPGATILRMSHIEPRHDSSLS